MKLESPDAKNIGADYAMTFLNFLQMKKDIEELKEQVATIIEHIMGETK